MKMSTFQLMVLIAFGFFIVVGIAVFAIFGSSARNSGLGNVTIWGTTDTPIMESLLTSLRNQDKRFQKVVYVKKDPLTFNQELVNAMANGSGPDLFIVTQDNVANFSDKIILIPFGSVTQASFLSSFIDEGQLFLTPQGSLALPFSIDPLVMYWNKDMFASAGIAQPPMYWNDFLSLAPKITSIDTSSNVSRSAVALGEWQNVTHAKAILSALFMQAGDPIVTRDKSGSTVSVFGQTANGAPASSVLLFYTGFANPSKTTYSWNRSLPQSQSAFNSNQLATYFGFASENGAISAANPNLNFGISMLPQIKDSSTKITYGELSGIAIARTSRNVQGALLVAQALTTQQMQQQLVQLSGLPSARRDVTVDSSANASFFVFSQSALISHGWLDPNITSTNSIFQNMVESVLSGRLDPAAAVNEASQAMTQLTH